MTKDKKTEEIRDVEDKNNNTMKKTKNVNVNEKHIAPSNSKPDDKQLSAIQERLKSIINKQKELKEQKSSEDVSWWQLFKGYGEKFTLYMHEIGMSIGDKIQSIISYITLQPKEEVKGKDPSILVKATEIVGGSHDDIYSDNIKFQHTTYPQTAGPINFGFWIIFIFIGIGGVWAALAPITSSSPAEGKIVAPYEKALQNTYPSALEIKKIFVKEGELLKKGDKIAKLDSYLFQVEFNKLLHRVIKLKCMEKRLRLTLSSLDKAEKENLSYDNEMFDEFFKIDAFFTKHQDIFKDYFEMLSDLNIVKDDCIQNNLKIFEENVSSFISMKEIYINKMDNLKLNLQHSQKLYDLYKSELEKQEKLFIARKKINSNLFEQSRYEQIYHEILKKFKDVSVSIDDIKLKIIGNTNEYNKNVADFKNSFLEKLLDAQMKLDESIPDLEKNKQYWVNTLICAPYDSIVVAKRYNEGTMTQQQHDFEIVDIVPQDLQYNHIISARVKAQDILAIKQGANVEIKFAALESSGKVSPNFNGKVVSISQDIVLEQTVNRDENGKILPGGATMQQPFYLVTVELDKDEVDNYVKRYNLKNLFPVAGMQVSLQIEVGQKTLLQYLLTPLTKAWRVAMSGSV